MLFWARWQKPCKQLQLLAATALCLCAVAATPRAAVAETISGASLATCSPAPCQKATGVEEVTLPNVSNDDGTASTRSYGIERPQGLTGMAPAVLVFYGGNQCGVVPNSRFSQLAAAERFVVVYMAVPCGREDTWEKRDIGAPTTTTPNDEPYVSAVVADITRCPGQCVDPRRVYAAGMSSGGSMVADVLCDPTSSPLFRGYLIDSSSLQLFEGAPHCPSTNRSFFVMLALSNDGADAGIYYNTAPNPHLDVPTFAEWAADRLGCGGQPLLGRIGSPSPSTLTYTYAGPCAYATAGSPAVMALAVENGAHGWECQDSDPRARAGECTVMPTPPGLGPTGLPMTNGLFVEEEFWNFVAQGTSTPEPAPPLGQTEPPLVKIISPPEGSSVAGSVTIDLTATDRAGIENVRLELDGAELGRPQPVSGGGAGHYSMVWDTNAVADGSHVLRAIATDRDGNTAIATASVTVQNSPPTFTEAPTNITVETTLSTGAIVTYADPTATDGAGKPTPVTCYPESGAIFPVGETTVTCVAVDAGGQTTASFDITVRNRVGPTGTPASGSGLALATAPTAGETAFTAGETALTAGEPATWLALGDGWTAGADDPPYVSGTDSRVNRCRRALAAYTAIAAARLGVGSQAVVDHACERANVASFYDADRGDGEPRQLSWVGNADAVVTLSIGWNDTTMSTAIARCGRTPSRCRAAFGRRFEAALSALGGAPSGTHSLRRLLETIAAAAPTAEVLTVGYPQPFPLHARAACSVGSGGLRFTPVAMAWIDGEVRRLDRTIQASAAAAQVGYLDAEEAFAGHELCTRQTDVGSELGPNRRGQARLAQLIAGALG